MILKRQEKGDIVKALYDSSSILASTYNTATLELEIIFETGNRYSYQGVTKQDYFRLETSDSQGKTFNSHIKRYPSTKLEPVDPNFLINEAISLHSNERISEFNGWSSKLVAAWLEASKSCLIDPNSKDSQTEISSYVSEMEKFKIQLDLFIKKFK